MRNISVHEITKNIKEMCIEANHFLSSDMKQIFEEAVTREEAPLGKQILNQLEENLKIAAIGVGEFGSKITRKISEENKKDYLFLSSIILFLKEIGNNESRLSIDSHCYKLY